MRLFAAAELPEELALALAETQAALRDAVRGRYVAPGNLHVTLAFIGEVEPWRAADAQEALAAACAGHAPIACELGELGSFGRRQAATLWQGFREGASELGELAASVRRQLREAGLPFDGKTFLPHVTLMRAADLRAGSLPAPQLARGTVRRITLFASDLSGARPVYTPLHTQTLAQDGRRRL